MEKKALEDWSLEKAFKSVKGVVDVSSFGGPTKEYQMKLDPDEAGGLRPEHQRRWSSRSRTTTPTAAAVLLRQGEQQVNVQSLGLYTQRAGHRGHGGEDCERRGDHE